MRFTHDGVEYRIGFKYISGCVTSCRIWDVGRNILTTSGVATKSVNDRFNKEIARKVSLRRALDGMSREYRTAAWKAYHARKGSPAARRVSQPVATDIMQEAA